MPTEPFVNEIERARGPLHVATGHVAALLDPGRPSRARPTPDDLVRASDATGIRLVELLEELSGIEPARLADELGRLGVRSSGGRRLGALTDAERAEVADFVDFLVARHAVRRRRRPRSGSGGD